MPNILNVEVIPTGGIVKLFMQSEDQTAWKITRQALTPTVGHVYTLYEGPPLEAFPNDFPLWLDDGDGLGQPLNPAVLYRYEFITESSIAITEVQPACTMEIDYDDYLRILVRIIQAGVHSLVPPTDGAFTKKPVVYVSMPLTGQPPIPCISINEDMLQQEETPISHGMNLDTTRNQFQIEEMVMRRYRVTVFTSSVEVREFYKFSIIALFKSVLIPLFNTMGMDVKSSFQAASSQMVDISPGFYFCEIMLQFSGVMPVRIKTNYAPFALATDFETDPITPYDLIKPPFITELRNDGGVLALLSVNLYPTSDEGLEPGALWFNGLTIAIVDGKLPDPGAPPIYYGTITATELLAIGGGNLPLKAGPKGSLILWNNNLEVSVS